MPAPPRRPRSINATCLPKYAACAAAFSPAGPEPITIRSNCSTAVPTANLPRYSQIYFPYSRSFCCVPLSSPIVNQIRDERRPSCLVTCTQSRAVVAVKIFVEQMQIAPVRIFLKLLRSAVDGPPSVGAATKQSDHAFRQFPRHLPRRQRAPFAVCHRHCEFRPERFAEFAERFDQQKRR